MNVAGIRTTSGFSGFTSEFVSGSTHGVDMIPLNDAAVYRACVAVGRSSWARPIYRSLPAAAANANNSTFGPTFNAYNRAYAPGGSSSGTAVAVSGSFATLGTAEETGGSIQNPSGATGWSA